MSYYDVDRRNSGLLPGTGTRATGSLGGPPGEKTTGEYIVSGIPFVKTVTQDGNTNTLTFPQLTQWIIIDNQGAGSMKIGFTEGGVDSNEHFVVRATTTTPRLPIRVKSITYDGTGTQTFSVIAGLTAITTGSIADYTHNDYWGM